MTGNHYAVHKAARGCGPNGEAGQIGLRKPTEKVVYVINVSKVGDKELFRPVIGRLNRRYSYDSIDLAADMTDRQCLPGAPEPAMAGESPHLPSPTKTAGAPSAVSHSPSCPLLGEYNSRRWWRSSSTTAWCSAIDHSDFDPISKGMHACDQ